MLTGVRDFLFMERKKPSITFVYDADGSCGNHT